MIATQDTHTHTPSTAPTLRRSAPRHHRHRPTFWYDRSVGRLLAENGSPLTLPERHELADVLDAIAHTPSPTDHYTLWLLGGDRAANTPDRSYFTAPVKRGWELSNYQGGKAEDASGRSAQYTAAHDELDATIDVRLVASWFANVADIDTARRGYLRLWQVIRSTFGPTSVILPTPAMTGLELLQQNLPFGREYPQVHPDLMRMLWAMPQGRIELYTDRAEQHINADVDTLDGLYNLDGVFMYAATLREMPAGRLVEDTTPLVWEHAPGFYEVTAQVPEDWRHVGLLPVREGERVWYPWRRGWHCTPKGWFATFVTSAELQLAIRNGWRVRISRRYVWPDKQGDPLRGWSDRIKSVREAWSLITHDPLAPLVRDGLRHILLDPLGAFHRHQTFTDGFVAYGHEEDVPEDAYHIHREENGISYRVPTTPSRYHQLWQHPEWSATAWGRTRARGAGEMLRHPAEQLVAYRVDGVWLGYNPQYPPSTHAGAWRLKHAIDRPVKAPHNTGELLRLMRVARAASGGLD